MESPGDAPQKTPASYADFPDENEGGGWLKTAVQFFAIPMLIVILAVSVYLGVNLMIGGGPTTSADFVELLKSDAVTRRWHAATELAARLKNEVPEEFKTPAMVKSLCEALAKARAEKQDPPQLATMTLTILGRIGQPSAIPAVREAMNDKHPWTRSYAILVLAQLRDTESLDQIRAFASHEDPGTRQAALVATAQLEQIEGLPYHLSLETRELLKSKLGDREEDVRFSAALLLARVREREAALPVLKTMLSREYLNQLVPSSELDGRVKVNLYDVHSNLLMSALKAIDGLKCGDDPEVVTAVRKLTDSDGEGSADVRARARDVLAHWDENQGA